jgi:VWFA-related protein
VFFGSTHQRPTLEADHRFDQSESGLVQGDEAAHLSSTTRLVQVSVVVQDKHGNPIIGLTKDDFSLFDEKQAQAIQVFSVETNAIPENAPPPLPSDTYTNRLAERTAMPQSVTVILLDALNTEFSDQEYSRRRSSSFSAICSHRTASAFTRSITG